MASDGAADPDHLRTALLESEAAACEGFDDELVEDIVEAVQSEAFDQGWLQHEHDAQGRYQRLRRVKCAAAELKQALDTADPGDLRELAVMFKRQHLSIRDRSRGRSLMSVREDVGRIADAVDATKHSGGRTSDPSKRVVRAVARAIRRFGDERQQATDDGEPPTLRRGENLAFVVCEVLEALGRPTSLSHETILTYARRESDV